MTSDANQPDQPAADFPTVGRLIGIDYGTRRVGVAISSPDQSIAGPLENYQRRTERLDAAFFKEIVEENRAAGFVVGLPVHSRGDESQKSIEARAYGKWLHEITGLPVRFWDERYTSQRAEEALLAVDMSRKKRKKRMDQVAATFMLQAYLDAPDRTAAPPPM